MGEREEGVPYPFRKWVVWQKKRKSVWRWKSIMHASAVSIMRSSVTVTVNFPSIWLNPNQLWWIQAWYTVMLSEQNSPSMELFFYKLYNLHRRNPNLGQFTFFAELTLQQGANRTKLAFQASYKSYWAMQDNSAQTLLVMIAYKWENYSSSDR